MDKKVIQCLNCNKFREMPPSKADRKFCSQKCYWAFKLGKPNGLKGRVFKPSTLERMRISHLGHTAWNKGLKLNLEQKSRLNLDGLRLGRELRDEASPNWKGDKVGYMALHQWVYRHLGQPSYCENCPRTIGRFDWANKSGEYRRDLEDWIRLCRRCHIKYDKCLRSGRMNG